MKKWFPTLATAGGILLTAFTPSIQHGLANFATHHATAAVTISGVFSIISHLWTSPLSGDNTQGK